jgi:RhtB (resistance to homoserine/threonine) family protein
VCVRHWPGNFYHFMPDYWHEFAVLAGLHLLAVITPGQDFAIVLRQSLTWDLATALRTSLGIGLGILFHSIYCLLGLGLLLAQSEWAFFAVKCLGAGYLAWIGISTFRTQPAQVRTDAGTPIADQRPTAGHAVLAGFLTNALNPKAAIFFLALFSAVVSAKTPLLLRAGYCVWMAVTTFLWFACVAVFFARASVRQAFLRFGPWLSRILGAAFILLALLLALAVAK